MNWAALIPIVMGMMNQDSGSSTVSQKPLQSEEQKAIEELLAGFAKTGKYGKYTAGEDYNAPIGDYSKSDLEAGSQDKLAGMLSGGLPEIYGMGTNELKTLFSKDSIYDPMKSGIYDTFKKQARKNQAESSTALDKTMAATGNFYSGARNVEQRKLAENTNDSLNSKLATMYDTYTQRRLGAIPTALNAGMQEENMNLNRVGAGMKYGGLDRTLKTQELTDKYNEWKRAREDMLTPLKSAGTVLGNNPTWGADSMTVPNANPWQKIFDYGLDLYGKELAKG